MSESTVPHNVPSRAGECWFKNRNLDETFFYRLERDEEVLWTYESARASGGYRFSNWFGLAFLVLCLITFWAVLVQEFSFQAIERVAGSPAFWALAAILAGPGIVFTSWMFLRTNRFAYAITDRRVFVMNSLSPIVINEFRPADLKHIVSFGSDDLGTVVIDQSPWWPGQPLNPRRLSNIPEPHKVRALIEARLISPAHGTSAA